MSEIGLSDQRKSAIIAGASLILMAAAAFFAYGYAHARLVVPQDVAATLQNISSQSMLFKAEILGWILILLCDVAAAWACYIFLKPANRCLSLLGAWLRLVYSALLGIAVMNLMHVSVLSNGTGEFPGFAPDQIGALTMLHLRAFESIWNIGLIVFGGHLLVLGVLALRSSGVPRWIGVLLLIASAGYVLVHLCEFLFADYALLNDMLEWGFIVPMTAGELGFGLWMLLRGGRSKARS